MKTFAFFFAAFCWTFFEDGKAQECGIGSAGAIFANYFEDKYDVDRVMLQYKIKHKLSPKQFVINSFNNFAMYYNIYRLLVGIQ